MWNQAVSATLAHKGVDTELRTPLEPGANFNEDVCEGVYAELCTCLTGESTATTDMKHGMPGEHPMLEHEQ